MGAKPRGRGGKAAAWRSCVIPGSSRQLFSLLVCTLCCSPCGSQTVLCEIAVEFGRARPNLTCHFSFELRRIHSDVLIERFNASAGIVQLAECKRRSDSYQCTPQVSGVTFIADSGNASRNSSTGGSKRLTLGLPLSDLEAAVDGEDLTYICDVIGVTPLPCTFPSIGPPEVPVLEWTASTSDSIEVSWDYYGDYYGDNPIQAPDMSARIPLVKETSDTTVTLNFIGAVTGATICPIRFYTVKYRRYGHVLWERLDNNISADVEETTVGELTPDSQYTMVVTAHSDAGAPSCNLHFTTLPSPHETDNTTGKEDRGSRTTTNTGSKGPLIALALSLAAAALIILGLIFFLCKRRVRRSGIAWLDDEEQESTAGADNLSLQDQNAML